MKARLARLALLALALPAARSGAGRTTSVPLRMSEVTVGGDDAYMACSTELPKEASHIVRFEPVADMSVVHHMLLYLCTEKPMARRPRHARASA